MMNKKKLFFAVLSTLGLGACSTLEGVTDRKSAATSFAAGSTLDYRLNSRDRVALGEAFVVAMDKGRAQTWRTPTAAGVIDPGSYALGNLLLNPNARILAVRGDFDLAHRMETELGLYVLTRNSNIRTGPGTDNAIAEVLPSGSGVDVVGRITNDSWMLIAIDGRVRGYVSQKLLIKAPGTEMELAGGPQRRPTLCREFHQRMEVASDRNGWDGTACNDGTGWQVAAPEIDPATQPQNLLEF